MAEQEKTCAGEVVIKVVIDDAEAKEKIASLKRDLEALSSGLKSFSNPE